MRNANCDYCILHTNCKTVCLWGTRPALGEFNGIMLVGEAPGAEEDKSGSPFVGKSGEVLTKILNEVGIVRSSCYITNAVKCRPDRNRTPDEKELKACKPYLLQEIQIMKPKVIITLGKIAFTSFFPENAKRLGTLKKIREYKYRTSNSNFLVPTYHPASTFHVKAYRKDIIADLLKAKELL